MTSTVTNYSANINVTYPTAGVDNDTQGFRDNFNYIQNRLMAIAKSTLDFIIEEEGFETKAYKDVKGLWTIGVGHLIGDGKKLPFTDKDGTTYTKDTYLTNPQVRALFEKDFEAHLKLAEKAPGWNLANQAGKTALIDLTFNMGPGWIKKFTKTSSLLEEGKFKEAAQELKRGSKGGDSLWYKQVKDRAKTIVGMIRGGGKSSEISKPKSIPSGSTSGSEIDRASKTNVDLKKNMEESEIQDTVNNNNDFFFLNDPKEKEVEKPKKKSTKKKSTKKKKDESMQLDNEIKTDVVTTESNGGENIIVKTKTKASFLFDKPDTVGEILGFINPGDKYSITKYSSAVSSTDPYVFSTDFNVVGNQRNYSSGVGQSTRTCSRYRGAQCRRERVCGRRSGEFGRGRE